MASPLEGKKMAEILKIPLKELKVWEGNPHRVDKTTVNEIAVSAIQRKAEGLEPQIVVGTVWKNPKTGDYEITAGQNRYHGLLKAQETDKSINYFRAEVMPGNIKPEAMKASAFIDQAQRRQNDVETVKYTIKDNFPQLIGMSLKGGTSRGTGPERKRIIIDGIVVTNRVKFIREVCKFPKTAIEVAFKELDAEARAGKETRFQANREQMEAIRKAQKNYWSAVDQEEKIKERVDKIAQKMLAGPRERQKNAKAALSEFPGGARQWLAERPRGM
jgi:hypothetical protein